MVKEIHDIKHLEKAGMQVDEMIEKLSGTDGEVMKENYEKYEPNQEALSELEEKAKDYLFVVFCAEWCGDCKTTAAYFAKIVKLKPSINGVFFKGLKSAPKDPDVRWRVPPSPPEVNDFDLRKIPTIFILNSEGKLVGEMIENPQIKSTVEEELVYILDNIQG
ncbi:MAG: thioredoxin family protein [Candidatus Heimdallarchaeota archaeon]|nr:thioredoxin family protein [Candidatus Heimdallarchaeota archaeon]MBY8994456.1 thioredoxin family protein [Candidatus Heimdallarchaeota archaeon]